MVVSAMHDNDIAVKAAASLINTHLCVTHLPSNTSMLAGAAFAPVKNCGVHTTTGPIYRSERAALRAHAAASVAIAWLENTRVALLRDKEPAGSDLIIAGDAPKAFHSFRSFLNTYQTPNLFVRSICAVDDRPVSCKHRVPAISPNWDARGPVDCSEVADLSTYTARHVTHHRPQHTPSALRRDEVPARRDLITACAATKPPHIAWALLHTLHSSDPSSRCEDAAYDTPHINTRRALQKNGRRRVNGSGARTTKSGIGA